MREDVPSYLKKIGSLVINGWNELAAKYEMSVTVSGRPASCHLQFEHRQNAELLTLMTTRMLEHSGVFAARANIAGGRS